MGTRWAVYVGPMRAPSVMPGLAEISRELSCFVFVWLRGHLASKNNFSLKRTGKNPPSVKLCILVRISVRHQKLAWIYLFIYLCICQNVRSTILTVNFTVQRAGQTGGCTELMAALKPRLNTRLKVNINQYRLNIGLTVETLQLRRTSRKQITQETPHKWHTQSTEGSQSSTYYQKFGSVNTWIIWLTEVNTAKTERNTVGSILQFCDKFHTHCYPY